MKIIPIENHKVIKQVALLTKIRFYLPQQTIIRQQSLADGFFYIINGLVEVTQESGRDFKDFDFFEQEELYNLIAKQNHEKNGT